MNPTESLLGIVIPTLDEAEALPSLLKDLAGIPVPHRVVVADGGSVDETADLARENGAILVEGHRGRAAQMNAGAQALASPWLLFLHADSRLPPESAQALLRWLEGARETDVGTFSFSLDAHGFGWRLLETGQKLRESLLGLAYGDQGLLVHRDRFREVGGFPDLPLMEDVEMLRRLRRRGCWRPLGAPLHTDPRRYREEGAFRSWLRNVILISLYLLGVSPERLSSFYRTRRTGGWEKLLVFAKAPDPGRVKTRLAREVGEEEAAKIYAALARHVVDEVRGGPYRTEICFTPPEAGDRVRGWLGVAGLSFHPQSEGDLGARMERAIRRSLEESHAVVVVGTDAPQVTSSLVERAFQELREADLVLGPALDGGYYLIGLKRPRPELFRAIPWSTSEVLEATLFRARSLGLKTHMLPALRDVDSLEDWQELRGSLSPPPPPR